MKKNHHSSEKYKNILFFSFQAQNTFVLALDGDVDFKPEAILLLVDRMRKNPKVAAACGRIHPTGGGTSTVIYFHF